MSTPPLTAGTALADGRTSSARPAPIQHLAILALPWVMMFWMFTGGFVFIEPSPYEFVFVGAVLVMLVAGTGLYRANLNLLNLLIFFMPFAFVGAWQVTHMTWLKGTIYVVVTMFLWLTSFFIANYVTDAPQRNMRTLMRGYTAAAVLITIVGTLAYLGLMPGSDLFLLYGRVRATFQDPNVFGPFLILPAMFAAQRVFLCTGRNALIAAVILGILLIGVFVSFSRAAWGAVVFSTAFVFAACYLLEATRRDRGRMLVFAMVGVGLAIAALAALLSIDSVAALFEERASIVQNYDSGPTGRFGRQAFAFELALAHPWGIGPLEFENLRVSEEPHNTYVKVLLTYGWFGGLAYWALVVLTLKKGIEVMLIASPLRLLMIPLMATFIPLVIESAIIDSDHWRHYFLVVGMIWGVAAARRHPERLEGRASSLL